MSKTHNEQAETVTRETVHVEDAPGAAADLAQDEPDSTWEAIVRKHTSAIPPWPRQSSGSGKGRPVAR